MKCSSGNGKHDREDTEWEGKSRASKGTNRMVGGNEAKSQGGSNHGQTIIENLFQILRTVCPTFARYGSEVLILRTETLL